MNQKRTKKGHLFIFEGPDGVGKSSIASTLADAYRGTRHEFDILSFPGRDPGSLGHLVYSIHHDSAKHGLDGMSPASLQVLHVAAHIDALERSILPMLNAGRNIILDRFWWSIWVYGVTQGLSPKVLRKILSLELAFWREIRTAAVFLIQRGSPLNRDVKEAEWNALALEYELLADREMQKYPIYKIGNESHIGEALAAVKKNIDQVLFAEKKSRVTIEPKNSHQQPLDFTKTLGSKVRSVPATIVSHLYPAKPTIVFDAYWHFAAERQRVFFKRLHGSPPPLTDDPIISRHKFTNAYRASDRVSQFLIRDVIYNEELPSEDREVFFRIMLFKFFNKIDTWNLLRRSLGEFTFANFDFEACDAILTRAMREGRSIYSAAYIMPSGGKNFGLSVKHRTHLKLLKMMMEDDLHVRLSDCSNMQKAFDLFLTYPTVGDFLAYQFITDVNYSLITNFSEMEFVVPGPGARNGIQKCFEDRGGLTEAELIRFVTERQEVEFERLGIEFQSLWGRPLQLIDCQNLFCEVDKYARVKYPDISGISGRTRIKQIYRRNSEPIDYWYPPKWEINDRILR